MGWESAGVVGFDLGPLPLWCSTGAIMSVTNVFFMLRMSKNNLCNHNVKVNR